MAAIPRKISLWWLQQQQTKLDCTSRADRATGEPNPNHATLAAEIEAAKAEIARRDAFEAWVKRSWGAVPNQYPLRADGRSYEPGTVFFAKDKATGRVTTWTPDEAWQAYESATATT